MSKINASKKGKVGEKYIAEHYIKDGYAVDQRSHVTFQNNDYFNLFDGVAWGHMGFIWYQVKSSMSHVNKARKEILAFVERNSYPSECLVRVHCVLYNPKFKYVPSGFRTWELGSDYEWEEL